MTTTPQAPATTPVFGAAIRDRAREIMARYPAGRERSALLPMLHLVQSEQGYVSPEGMAFCADLLGITRAQVAAVATFYTMYKRRPAGDWLVSVCTNTMCGVLGGDKAFDALRELLGVGHDETTADGTITLEHAECLAACDYAPVMTVNYEFFDNVTEDSALEVVQALQRGERPAPTRGAPLVDFREISRQLAGFVSPTAPAVDGHPTPPEPVDVRGTVDLAGTDAEPSGAEGYGVPGGVTERVLPDSAAAATYGGGVADAGASPVSNEPSPARDRSDAN